MALYFYSLSQENPIKKLYSKNVEIHLECMYIRNKIYSTRWLSEIRLYNPIYFRTIISLHTEQAKFQVIKFFGNFQ